MAMPARGRARPWALPWLCIVSGARSTLSPRGCAAPFLCQPLSLCPPLRRTPRALSAPSFYRAWRRLAVPGGVEQCGALVGRVGVDVVANVPGAPLRALGHIDQVQPPRTAERAGVTAGRAWDAVRVVRVLVIYGAVRRPAVLGRQLVDGKAVRVHGAAADVGAVQMAGGVLHLQGHATRGSASRGERSPALLLFRKGWLSVPPREPWRREAICHSAPASRSQRPRRKRTARVGVGLCSPQRPPPPFPRRGAQRPGSGWRPATRTAPSRAHRSRAR